MTNNNINQLEEDEIDLRELFATIVRYKKSIFFITLIGTLLAIVIAYRMPKYYETSVSIEIKAKDSSGGGFSLGGAGALLGLAGLGGAGDDSAKDMALLESYKINSMIIPKVNYQARYIYHNRFRDIELNENNSSISVSNVHMGVYKNNGVRVLFKEIDNNHFQLYLPGKFINELLGEYKYGVDIKTSVFSLIIYKNTVGVTPSSIILSGNKHHIYETLVKKNLTIAQDKESPFVSIKYIDTIPERGNLYINELLKSYINFSVKDEIKDLDITLNSINKQIIEIEKRVANSDSKLANFKEKKLIISPEEQARVLVETIAQSDVDVSKGEYAEELITNIIKFTRKHKNIDAIAPSLLELEDQPTIELITKLQTLQLEEGKLSQEYKSAYPALKSVRGQIRSVKKKILANIKNLKKTIVNKNKSLRKLNKKYKDKLASTPKVEKKFISISRNYELNQKLYAYLLQKRSATEIKKAETLSRIKIAEAIYTKPNAVKPKKALIVIVSFITLIILSIFIAFFREFLRSGREERVEKVEEES